MNVDRRGMEEMKSHGGKGEVGEVKSSVGKGKVGKGKVR